VSVSLLGNLENIGVFGLGKTGNSVYQSLNKVAKVICYDQNSNSREAFAKIYGADNIVNLSDPRWLTLDKIVLSPGVPLSHDLVKMANAHNITITSDIDLLFDKSSKANFIAITGTNGKSTTTALIGHILQFCGLNYPVGGNIGNPVLTLKSDCAGYVLELSSFQLDLLKSFKAKIAVLLNITPDHLDRHHNMENYIAAKKKLFDRMADDSFAVINVDDALTNQIFLELKEENSMNLLPISVTQRLSRGISINDNVLYDNIFESIIIPLPKNKSLQGLHNQENIAASFAVCRIMGLSAKQIIAAIEQFHGLPHRMQYIGTVANISFYNDSKATNAIAASKSISSLNNIYWLAGGVAKEGGISDLLPWLPNIRKAYIFGQDKDVFASALSGKVEFQICQDLTEAFNSAFMEAKENKDSLKNILLAPACASYDQFKNFEERGDLFIKLCNNKIAEYS
jgi:UDP-N-acetylmuramoylalanine--D-glutamate ligase